MATALALALSRSAPSSSCHGRSASHFVAVQRTMKRRETLGDPILVGIKPKGKTKYNPVAHKLEKSCGYQALVTHSHGCHQPSLQMNAEAITSLAGWRAHLHCQANS